MTKRADLSPALGYPGGPCHLQERVDQVVQNPRVRDDILNTINWQGHLDKRQERIIYDRLVERDQRGRIVLEPHVQHRMDQRGITVSEVKLALKEFITSNDPMRLRLDRGERVTYQSKKVSSLVVVFGKDGRDVVIITAYWKGVPDPPPPKGKCEVVGTSVRLAMTPQEHPAWDGRRHKIMKVSGTVYHGTSGAKAKLLMSPQGPNHPGAPVKMRKWVGPIGFYVTAVLSRAVEYARNLAASKGDVPVVLSWDAGQLGLGEVLFSLREPTEADIGLARDLGVSGMRGPGDWGILVFHPWSVPGTAVDSRTATDKQIKVPYSFKKVVLQPAKRKRKKWPFQGFIDFQGLLIDVENKRGSFREGKDENGEPWKVEMHHHYGEIRKTEGVDGDLLDAYIGENADSPLVVVIHQQDPDTKKYDEDKVMLGFDSVPDAIKAYKAQYDKPGFYQDRSVLNIGEFWRWCGEDRNHGRKVKKASEVLAYRASYKRRRRQRNPGAKRKRREYSRRTRTQRKTYQKTYRKKNRQSLRRRRQHKPLKVLSSIQMPLMTMAPYIGEGFIVPAHTRGDVVGFDWSEDWAFVDFDHPKLDTIAVPLDTLLMGSMLFSEDDEDFIEKNYIFVDVDDDGTKERLVESPTTEYDPVDVDEDHPAYLGGFSDPTTPYIKHAADRWTCEYCGSLNEPWDLRCRNCGAPRQSGPGVKRPPSRDRGPRTRQELERMFIQDDIEELTDYAFEEKYGEPKPRSHRLKDFLRRHASIQPVWVFDAATLGVRLAQGDGDTSGLYVEFIKEHGDETVTNPTTNRQVKFKSLNKTPEGRKIQQEEFRKWRESRRDESPVERKEETEKGKEKKPDLRTIDELELEWMKDDWEELADYAFEEKYGEPKPDEKGFAAFLKEKQEEIERAKAEGEKPEATGTGEKPSKKKPSKEKSGQPQKGGPEFEKARREWAQNIKDPKERKRVLKMSPSEFAAMKGAIADDGDESRTASWTFDLTTLDVYPGDR